LWTLLGKLVAQVDVAGLGKQLVEPELVGEVRALYLVIQASIPFQ
jgi:hypothetical protein